MILVLTYWEKWGKLGKSCSLQEKYLHSTQRKTIYIQKEGTSSFQKIYSFPWVLWRHLSYCNHDFPIIPSTSVPFSHGRNHIENIKSCQPEVELRQPDNRLQSYHGHLNLCCVLSLNCECAPTWPTLLPILKIIDNPLLWYITCTSLLLGCDYWHFFQFCKAAFTLHVRLL